MLTQTNGILFRKNLLFLNKKLEQKQALYYINYSAEHFTKIRHRKKKCFSKLNKLKLYF